MPVRNGLIVSLLVSGALALAACQPTVGVSRATANLPVPDPAPKDPALVPVRPSAIEGARIFKAVRDGGKGECVQCHGPEGLGDGPIAQALTSPGISVMTDFFQLLGIEVEGERLPSRPANFHNTVAMRLNSPFSMYETVTRGRPHTAMPAFPGPGGKPGYGATRFGSPPISLTDEERWHVVFHEWTYATTLQEVIRGKQIYETREFDIEGRGALTCASCHGTEGNGRGPVGEELSRTIWEWARGQGRGIFTDINLMAQRKPTELYQAIVDGGLVMPSYRGKLTDDEIWALVNYIYTFIYDYPWPPGTARAP